MDTKKLILFAGLFYYPMWGIVWFVTAAISMWLFVPAVLGGYYITIKNQPRWRRSPEER